MLYFQNNFLIECKNNDKSLRPRRNTGEAISIITNGLLRRFAPRNGNLSENVYGKQSKGRRAVLPNALLRATEGSAAISFLKSILRASFLIFLCMGLFNAFPSHADESPVFQRLAPGDYPKFEDDLNLDQLAHAITASIEYFNKQSPLTNIGFGEDTYSTRHLAKSLQTFLSFIQTHSSTDELQEFIYQRYYVYAYIKDWPKEANPVDMLFTGYYEPMLNGSRQKTDKFKYPVYSRPKDLVTFDLADFSNAGVSEKVVGRYTGDSVVPYFSRQEISGTDILNSVAPPIAWVDDPVDLFFLHIQGSGKIALDDGAVINVHYLISNGCPYKSVGKYLIEKNKLSKEEVSMQTIRSYLRAHPHEMDEIFNYNPRYVFFEEVAAGPMGCFNIELAPGRSIALDKKQYPPATLAFIQAQKPVAADDGAISAWADFSRFVMNQDTGSAISGPARADIFWGSGQYAEFAAGLMKQPGRLYFLVLNPFFSD